MNPSLTAAVIAKELISKVKAMQTFEITQDLPDHFEFGGVVPFDLSIKDGKLTCHVPALTLEQAIDMVDRWLADRTGGDEL
jgi:hypothetical protein